MQGAGLLAHQRLQLQQLPRQRRQNFKDRHIVIELPVAAANAVAGQHTNHLAVDLNRQRNKGHHFLRQLCPRDRTGQKLRLGIDVLHDDGLRRGQYPARDAFGWAIAASRGFSFGQAVGVTNAGGGMAGRVARCHPFWFAVCQSIVCNVPDKICQHNAAPVQAQQFRHEVQHLAQHHIGRQAFADQPHHLAHQQQLLRPPFGGGFC